MLLTNRHTGMMWDYYLDQRTTESITLTLNHFLTLWKNQYQYTVRAIETDNEITTQLPSIARACSRYVTDCCRIPYIASGLDADANGFVV